MSPMSFQCLQFVIAMSSKCPQQITPFRSQAPNEMRLRQRVKGSLPNLPLEACLSSTGWYVWKSRRLAALSHVTIAVGAPGPVTCHRVMRGTRERISHMWASNLPGMVAPVWALTHCAHCAGERLARACNTRGDTGKDTRAERRPGQSKAEKSWAGNALFLGNSSELREQLEIAGGREHFKVLENQ